jgi:FkbM family methyltransferase
MLKQATKKLLRNMGIHLGRYDLQTSELARMQRWFEYHKIDLVLDVGANVGQYGKYLRELGYAGRIVSFEPLSSAYPLLLAACAKDPLWQVAPRAAIGDRIGEITINIAGNSLSSSVLPMLDAHLAAAPESAYHGSETVRLLTLNAAAKQYLTSQTASAYLKIDVQGFEKKVLDGATEILPSIRGIEVELSLVPLYDGQVLFKELIDNMEQLGYELHGIQTGYIDRESGRMLQVDGVFFKS